MIVGVLTTCHTQCTWDGNICTFLFDRTTLQVFVTYLTGAVYMHPLWFYKHQHDNRVRSKLFVACLRWWFQWRFWFVEWKRNLVAHCDAREEKWRGKRRMEWVASSLQLDSEQSIQCYYNRSPPTRTPREPVLDWTDTPADINGLVRFAGRPNLVCALVPSRSVFTLPSVPGYLREEEEHKRDPSRNPIERNRMVLHLETSCWNPDNHFE